MARASLVGAGLLILAAVALVAAAPAYASPTPPGSGDWVVDPAEVANVSVGETVVHGNITLSANSVLNIVGGRLTMNDSAQKVAILGPASSRLNAAACTIGAAVGPQSGGFGFYIHVDGVVTIESCTVTGLSGLTVPTPFGETEGIHLTNSASSVSNSSVIASQGYGITVTAQAGTVSPRIEGNTITRNGGGVFAGGLIIFGADAHIRGNAFSLNALPDILVIASNPRIEDNSFFGSTAGVAVISGTPRIVRNSFTAHLTAAIIVTSGGADIADNTITASGAAFQFISADIQLNRNSVTLTGAGLLASDSRVGATALSITGALGPALSLNGSSLSLHGPCPLSSTLGAAAVTATNGSDLYLESCDISSAQGAAVSADGGSLTLDKVVARGFTSAVVTANCAATFRFANLTGGGSAPALSMRAGTLDLSLTSVTGGDDGLSLDNVSALISEPRIAGNQGWGIYALHRGPSISADDVLNGISSNGLGDLRVEADLTVLVRRSDSNPAANATVSIEDAMGGSAMTGRTDSSGTVGPVRLLIRQVDSLNNDEVFSPFAVRAFLAPNLRARGAAALVADETLPLVLAANAMPIVSLDSPQTALVGAFFVVSARATDADNDSLEFSWTTDDGRLFEGPNATLAFGTPGNHTLTASVFDGFETAVFSRGIAVLTPEQANRPPFFTTEPKAEAQLGANYLYTVSALDSDADSALNFQLIAGPLGMTMLSQPRSTSANLVWEPDRYYEKTASALLMSFEVSLLVSDGLSFVYQNFTLTLRGAPDQAPAWTALPAQSIQSGSSVSLQLDSHLVDPDDPLDSLRISVVNVTGGEGLIISIDSRGGSRSLLIVLLSSSMAGPREARITLEATDAAGLSSQAEIVVTIDGGSTAFAPTETSGAGTLAVALIVSTGAMVVALWALATRQGSRKDD